MNDERERTWKEVALAQFKTLCGHLPGGTEENHEKSQYIRSPG
jgi:hypothetical protein